MRSDGFWTLNKAIVLVLLGAFAMLLTEIRFDHNDVLTETWKGWIPIVYSVAMILAICIGLVSWDRGGRQLLMLGFFAALVVGALGFYFHNQGRMVPRVMAMVSLLAEPPKKMPKPAPPAMAPAPPAMAPAQATGTKPGAGKSGAGEHGAGGHGAKDAGKAAGPAAARPPRPLISRNGPPVFAPLAFAGLGLIGMLACLRGRPGGGSRG